VNIAPVTGDRWNDLADLFERPGPRGGTPIPAGCWCMAWRRRTRSPAQNRRAMQALVADGRRPGLIACRAGRAVGWVAVAPREEYGQLLRSPAYGPFDDEAGVWSIVCFYVDPRARRRGVAKALLAAATEHALDQGATAVEAYPHERGDYMGTVSMFERAGFEELRTASVRRVLRRGKESDCPRVVQFR
jgi:GNAT superfamily N-acetyltransferase